MCLKAPKSTVPASRPVISATWNAHCWSIHWKVKVVKMKMKKATKRLIQQSPPSNLSNQQTQVFEEVFKRSSSMANYAKNLVFELFKRNELVGKNYAGVKGKQGIGDDSRMAIIKENVFKKYRVPDKTRAWVQCRKAIDTALRKMKYSL